MAVGISSQSEQPADGSLNPVAHRGVEPADHSALLAIVNVVLAYRRLVLACVVVVTAVLVGLALSAPRTYTSTAAFMPHVSGGALAGLSNLAAQLGVNVGKDDPTQSPDFYAEVIKSRDLLTTLAKSSYTIKGATPRTGPLADLLELEPAPPEQRMDNALKRLQRMIFVNVTRQTGIMHVNVTSPDPDLSREISERLLRVLDDFNTTLRQNQAGAEEKFLEQREDEARGAQAVAENRVVEFLRSNREYARAPTLAHEFSASTRKRSIAPTSSRRSPRRAHRPASRRHETRRSSPCSIVQIGRCDPMAEGFCAQVCWRLCSDPSSGSCSHSSRMPSATRRTMSSRASSFACGLRPCMISGTHCVR